MVKVGITCVLLAIILALIPCLPALARDTGTITITMTGVDEISIAITLEPTEWYIGDIAADMERKTSPPIEWCILTNTGNVDIDTFIEGEDAKWVDNPGAYKWMLSSDGTNGEDTYGLWFRISGDTARGYVPVTKAESEFWPYIEPVQHKQFGLKLLTPTSFDADKQMQTHIIISAVAAS